MVDDKTFNDILLLLRKGMTVQDISKELGIPKGLVYRVARNTGVTNNPDEKGKII